jgi:hypothetical protein
MKTEEPAWRFIRHTSFRTYVIRRRIGNHLVKRPIVVEYYPCDYFSKIVSCPTDRNFYFLRNYSVSFPSLSLQTLARIFID